MTEREILLDAIDIIGYYGKKIRVDDTEKFIAVPCYPELIEGIKNFMKENGYFREEDW